MSGRSALIVAIGLLKSPTRIHAARTAELASDVPDLLAVAVGDAEAMRRAEEKTGCTRDLLAEAASFFIEQIMLDRQSDAYRILGCNAASPRAELRRNMAYMMKWLHPDRSTREAHHAIDRSIYVTRVTEAWENLKTDERRRSYDLARSVVALPESNAKRRRSARLAPLVMAAATAGTPRARREPGRVEPLGQRRPPLMRLWFGLMSFLRVYR